MKVFLITLIIVILALCVIALKCHWIWKKRKRQYALLQSSHTPISDEVFCEKLGLDISAVRVISIIRSEIAELGCYDPLRIYPDDTFHPHFGLDYDDDVAILIQKMKIIEGYREYSFPLEEVDTIGDFVKIVLRLKKEFEARASQAQ